MFEVVEEKDVTGVLRETTGYTLLLLFVLNVFVTAMFVPAYTGNAEYSDIVDTFDSEASYAEILNSMVVLSAVLSSIAVITHTTSLIFESRDKKIVVTKKRFIPERKEE